MKIELAYPFEGHAPDETVDLPADQARQMVIDGLARPALPADEETTAALTRPTDNRTVAELRAYAAERGIDLTGASRRADIAALIGAAEATQVTTTQPVSGTTSEEAV